MAQPGKGGVVKRLEPLQVQRRQTILRDGTVRDERVVFCPSEERWVWLSRCRACDECAHLSGDVAPVLVCSVSLPTASRAVAAASVRGLLAPTVWCIEACAPAHLVQRMPSSQTAAVVVDDDGHAIGLLASDVAGRAPAEASAQSVMNPVVIALLDGAPATRAHELLAQDGVRILPVVSGGRVVGCVNADG